MGGWRYDESASRSSVGYLTAFGGILYYRIVLCKSGIVHHNIQPVNVQYNGPDSSVGIATNCGLDGPGIQSRWGRDFPHLSRAGLAPTQPSVNGYRVFPGGKKRPARDADPSPPSSVVVMKG